MRLVKHPKNTILLATLIHLCYLAISNILLLFQNRSYSLVSTYRVRISLGSLCTGGFPICGVFQVWFWHNNKHSPDASRQPHSPHFSISCEIPQHFCPNKYTVGIRGDGELCTLFCGMMIKLFANNLRSLGLGGTGSGCPRHRCRPRQLPRRQSAR